MDESLPTLPEACLAAADNAALNLGVGRGLRDLAPEHWQTVLTNVEARMRLHGVDLPDQWQGALAERVGRVLG